MNKKEKDIIHNTFLDFVFLIMSFFLTFVRSLKLFIWKRGKIKTFLFDVFDYVLRIWPRYFWKNPSLLKVSSFVGDLLYFIFKR